MTNISNPKIKVCLTCLGNEQENGKLLNKDVHIAYNIRRLTIISAVYQMGAEIPSSLFSPNAPTALVHFTNRHSHF
jgi:hypothetical protein